MAVVQMTDFFEPNSRTRKLKVSLPAEQVAPYALAKKPGEQGRRAWAPIAVQQYAAPIWLNTYSMASAPRCGLTAPQSSQRLREVIPAARRAPREVAARSKEEEWERAAGVDYSIPRWAALDRERAPKKARRAADAPPLHGPPLAERLRLLREAPPSGRFPPGTRLWVRVPGSGLWPGLAWAFALCKRRDWGELLLSHRPGEALRRTARLQLVPQGLKKH
jgi:hypothetical protein